MLEIQNVIIDELKSEDFSVQIAHYVKTDKNDRIFSIVLVFGSFLVSSLIVYASLKWLKQKEKQISSLANIDPEQLARIQELSAQLSNELPKIKR